jgi:hypothetical protein
VNYFTKELATFKNNWKSMITSNLLQGPQPLIGGLVGGFDNPLILLADAFKMNSTILAIEVLAINAIDYNALHKVLDITLPQHTRTLLTPQEIINRISHDQTFNELLTAPGVQNTARILTNPEAANAVFRYLNMLDVTNLPNLMPQCADLAALLECAVHKRGEPAFDFYLNHILTLTSSIRISLPIFPVECSVQFVRSLPVLITIAYISQLRPKIDTELIEAVELAEGMTWGDVFRDFHEGEGLEGKWLEAHLLRAMRNLMEFGKMWEEKEGFFMRAAVKLEREWVQWTGGGEDGEARLNVVDDLTNAVEGDEQRS